MIYLALVMVSSPILIMIFFIFYKSFLFLLNDKTKDLKKYEETFLPKATSQYMPQQTQVVQTDSESEDEIAIVVSSAVSYYLQKT